MKIYKLSESDVLKAIDTAEDGMGYQIANLQTAMGYSTATPTSGILINRQYYVPLDDAPMLPGEHGYSPKYRDLSEGLLLQPPIDVEDLDQTPNYMRRTLLLESARTRGARLFATTTSTVFPPHVGTTVAGEVFYRFSAFRTDRSVLPDGRLAIKTYATTGTDKTVVPSGLAAVGRYALPTRISAKEVFEIKPLAGTRILYGTVTPNYGLAGGGVEVFFPDGTAAGTVRLISPLPEK